MLRTTRGRAAIAAAAALGAALLAVRAPAEAPPLPARAAGGERLDGVVLVRLRGAYGTLAAADAAAGPRLRLRGMSLGPAACGLPWARVRLPEGLSVEEGLAALAADPAFDVVQPVRVYRAAVLPNDPEFGTEWHLHNTGQSGGTADADIDAPEAWDLFLGETTVEIAVLDTGADTDHGDLAARLRIVAGSDVLSGDADPNDDSTVLASGHGTAVAAVAGAVTNNATQVAGVTWYGRIVPIRVLDIDGAGASDSVAAGIDLARTAGVRVINLSVGTEASPGDDPVLDAALRSAAAAGIVVVASAGNDGGDVLYPANSPYVIAVGATTRSGAVASFSSRGIDLDLVAPGSEIRTLANQNGVQTRSGTSFSAPIAAGAAALAAGARPGVDSASVARWLRATAATARTSAWTTSAGAGTVNLRRLVEIALSNPLYAADTRTVLFDSFAGSARAETSFGLSFATGRAGDSGLALAETAFAGYAPDSIPDTGTVEFYWRPRRLPSGAETRALLAAETVSLSVDAAGALALRVGTASVSSATRVHADQWYHLAVVHDETHVALFVNGVEEETRAANGTFAADTLFVGRRPGGGDSSAAGVYDQLRASSVSRGIFPSALDAAVPNGSWAASTIDTLTAPWWTLSSETRPVTVTIGADLDASGLDGTVLGTGLLDDMRERLSIASLAIGTPYHLYVVASDGLDTAWAYSALRFTPAEAGDDAVAASDGGSCLLERAGLGGRLASRLRAARDRLLAAPFGRLLALVYYAA